MFRATGANGRFEEDASDMFRATGANGRFEEDASAKTMFTSTLECYQRRFCRWCPWNSHCAAQGGQNPSELMTGQASEQMPIKTSEDSPETFPSFMINDKSECIPDLMPRQASEHCVNPRVRPRLSR